MDKINVCLYGGKGIFGGKETPLRAETIYCDKYNNCSLYSDGKCLKVTSINDLGCKFGRMEVSKGYTSRSQKYYSFKNKYKCDEKYAKLKSPMDCYFAVIDDYAFINTVYVRLEKNDYGNYIVNSDCWTNGKCWINLSELTVDLLKTLCDRKPQAIFGGTIERYQVEIIPDMLQQIRKSLPDLYYSFIEKYPKHNKEPNYIGKYAYINTMVDGSILKDCHNNKFTLKNGKLYCDEMTRGFVPFNGVAKVEVKVSDTKTYKIDNNNQCDENTTFA